MDQPKDNSTVSTGRWAEDEHKIFVEALNKYGKNWEKITKEVKSRTLTQVRSHAQKYFLKAEGRRGNSGIPKPRPVYVAPYDPYILLTKHLRLMQMLESRARIQKRMGNVNVPIFDSFSCSSEVQAEHIKPEVDDMSLGPYKKAKIAD